MLRLILAWLHLLALGVGLGAIWIRASSLRALRRGGDLRSVFTADTWWVVALSVWLVTGATRAFLGLERPGVYYLHSAVFWSKMALVGGLYVIELWPMAFLIQWGIWVARGRDVDLRAAPVLAALSYVQVALVVIIVTLAAAMARGYP